MFYKHSKIGRTKKFEAYINANWVVNVVDRRSLSGYCTFVGENLVTWRSKKHNVVNRSSAQVEFRQLLMEFVKLCG